MKHLFLSLKNIGINFVDKCLVDYYIQMVENETFKVYLRTAFLFFRTKNIENMFSN